MKEHKNFLKLTTLGVGSVMNVERDLPLMKR